MATEVAKGRKAARRARAGAVAARKLFAAVDALSAYLRACNDCRDGSGDEKTSIADGRHKLIGDMSEYATWLESKHDDVKGRTWVP